MTRFDWSIILLCFILLKVLLKHFLRDVVEVPCFDFIRCKNKCKLVNDYGFTF